MTNRRWFTPAPHPESASGVHDIIDPHTRQVVPPAGKWVDGYDPFWIRRGPAPMGDGGGSFSDGPPEGHEEHEAQE